MGKAIANPNPIQVIGRASECLRRLMEAGLTYQDLQRPIDDPEMRGRLVRFWQFGDYEATNSQNQAREIMGQNFFGIEEAIRHFDPSFSKKELVALAEVPYPETILKKRKDSHILVAVPRISILDIRGKVNSELFNDQSWYNEESFAKERGEASWQLIRKTLVPKSSSKNWAEQQVLLGKDDEVPTARMMFYTIIGLYLATGERLFETIYAWTSSVDSNSDHVGVGYFGSVGLCVFDYWDGNYSENLGLSCARKSS